MTILVPSNKILQIKTCKMHITHKQAQVTLVIKSYFSIKGHLCMLGFLCTSVQEKTRMNIKRNQQWLNAYDCRFVVYMKVIKPVQIKKENKKSSTNV